MKILRKDSYEHKGDGVKTRFKIDIYVFEEAYLWREGEFQFDFEETVNLNQLKDNEFGMCFAKLILHLPIDLRHGSEEIKSKIREIENLLTKHIHLDITAHLIELCAMIDRIPQIEKIYAPDFVLNEDGNYDDSSILDWLEKNTDYSPSILPCLIGTYTETTYEELKQNERLLIPDINKWVFNCMHFLFDFIPHEFEIQAIDKQTFFALIDQCFLDQVLDIISQPGCFLRIESVEDRDKEVALVYMNEQNEPLFYFFPDLAA